MSIQDVRAVILRVQPHIFEYDPGPPRDYNPDAPANNHETSTRYVIIDPILRSLGWDLSDPRDCVVEYRVSAGSRRAVDYALLDTMGRPVILVDRELTRPACFSQASYATGGSGIRASRSRSIRCPMVSVWPRSLASIRSRQRRSK